MTKKIYIDYENQDYYTSFEKVKAAYLSSYGAISFNDFLAENYDCEDIFNFTVEEREDAKADYDTYVIGEVKSWVDDCLVVIDVDVEFEFKEV